jgi:hypothetical protein
MDNVPIKQCIGLCGQFLPDTKEFFAESNHGVQTLRRKCRKCKNREDSQRKKLQEGRVRQEISKVILDPSDCCGCCGTSRGNILGDINDKTQEIYGYLCMGCYRLVRDFRADLERMYKVIDYVKKTRHNQ